MSADMGSRREHDAPSGFVSSSRLSASVLLVEDHAADARLVVEALTGSRWIDAEVVHHTSLHAALGALRGRSFDVVLLDLNLPDSHGIETVQAMLESAPSPAVVVLSGADESELAIESIRAGAQDYVVKGAIGSVHLERTLRHAVERKRNLLRVKEAEARYRNLFNASLEGIALIDEGRILDVNEAFTHMFQLRRTDLVGRAVVELVAPRFQSLTARHVQAADGAPFECVGERADGSRLDALFVVRRQVHGDEEASILIARDMTRARETERRLAENERWFRALTEQTTDVVAVLDRTGKAVFASPAIERLIGARPEELLRMRPWEMVHPDDLARVGASFEEALAEPGGEFTVRYRCRTQAGPHIHVETRGVNLLEDETVCGVIVSTRDISLQVEAEERLRANEERFRTLFENATVGLYRSTPDGQILLVNPALVKMMGFDDASGLMAMNVETDQLVGPAYDRGLWVRRMLDKGQVIGVEAKWRRQDGTTLWVRESATTARDPDGTIRYFEGVVEDITEQRAAQAELLHQKSILEAQNEAAQDGIVVVSSEGGVVTSNQRFVEMWGLDEGLLHVGRARDVLEAIAAECDAPEALTAMVLKIAGDDEAEVRDVIDLADGRVFELFSSPVRGGADGSTSGRAWFFHDSTDRFRSEALLERMAEQQRMILDSAGEGIMGLNHKGNVRFINPAGARMLGYEPDDLIGRSSASLIGDSGVGAPRRMLEILDAVLEGDQARTLHDERFSRRDGQDIAVDLVCTPLQEGGETVGAVVVFRDITERLLAEERFRSLLESTPDPMVIVDEEGRIVLVNERTVAVFGYERDELLGEYVEILVPDRFRHEHPEHRQRFVEHPDLRPMGTARDLIARRSDGAEFPVEVALSPLETDDGMLVIAAIRDVTERLAVQRQLRQRSEEMESFAYAVSHDLRTPLVSLDWLVKELRDHVASDEADADRLLERIHRNIGDMDRLVKGLLDLARIGQDEAASSDAVTDPRAVIGEVVGRLEAECKRRGVGVDVELGALPRLGVDPRRFEQIMANLIGNAVKFVETGSGRVEVRAVGPEDPVHKRRGTWRLEVHDNGPGVPDSHKSRIFRLFERAPDPLGRAIDGTGVGLALARKVARLYGGELDVTDRPGGGSVFFLELPRSLGVFEDVADAPSAEGGAKGQ